MQIVLLQHGYSCMFILDKYDILPKFLTVYFRSLFNASLFIWNINNSNVYYACYICKKLMSLYLLLLYVMILLCKFLCNIPINFFIVIGSIQNKVGNCTL